MKFKLLIFFLFSAVVVFNSCNKKDEPEPVKVKSQATSIADSLMRITDSLRGKDYLHKNFYGIHKHGQNLAVHAHQNIPKKIRMRKKAAKIKGKRIEAFNKSEERRKKRIEEYMKNKAAREEGKEAN